MSNTESAQTQWNELAASIGFPSETSMWDQLYSTEERSIAELAKTLGYGTATVARRIGICKVKKKGRGGANTPPRVYANMFHMDQRFVRLAHPEELAKLLDCSVHSVYRLRREA